jgi:hypothetical protein
VLYSRYYMVMNRLAKMLEINASAKFQAVPYEVRIGCEFSRRR